MARHKDVFWNLGDEGKRLTWEQAGIAVLMDLRDELKESNRRLKIVHTKLETISRKLPVKRKRATTRAKAQRSK